MLSLSELISASYWTLVLEFVVYLKMAFTLFTDLFSMTVSVVDYQSVQGILGRGKDSV
jgi:hypothetical protein